MSLLEKLAAADPVPCNGCTACCRGDQAVVLKDRWGDDPAAFGRENLQIENYHGTMQMTLKRKPNGDCIFLGLAVCTIHDKRPAACRQFDCRRIAVGLSEDQRAEAVRRELYSQAMIDAGVARVASVRLDPIEEPLYRMHADGWTEFGSYILERKAMV